MEQGPSQHSSSELGRDRLCVSPRPSPPNVLLTRLLQGVGAAWLEAP